MERAHELESGDIAFSITELSLSLQLQSKGGQENEPSVAGLRQLRHLASHVISLLLRSRLCFFRTCDTKLA